MPSNVDSTPMQANDTQVEVFDKWWDPASSIVVSAGGNKETRSDRLMLWTNQQLGSVSKIRNELRATRMEAFQADEESKQALSRARAAQEALEAQKKVRTSLDAAQEALGAQRLVRARPPRCGSSNLTLSDCAAFVWLHVHCPG